MHKLANLDSLIYHHDDVSFKHAKEISRPFQGLQAVLDWCKTECEPGWRWQLVDTPSDIRPGRYIFYFNDSKDYFAFLLKWG